jgi:hypothetical protein
VFGWRPSRQLPAQAASSAPRPPKLDVWDSCLGQAALSGIKPNRLSTVKVTRVIFAVASNKIQKGAGIHPKENIKMIPQNRDTTTNLQKHGPFVSFKKQLSILRQCCNL